MANLVNQNNTTDNTYNVHYTDLGVQPISIDEGTQDTTSTDITLFGRVKLEYGEPLDNDLLHLLENFACPESSTSTLSDSVPDYSLNNNSLQNPTGGQIWYNSTRKLLYYWNLSTNKWTPLGSRGSYTANWGQITDGNQIPAPINPYTNEPYPYTNCIWAVSPANIPTAFSYLLCTTDNNAVVTMKYRVYGTTTPISGTANYIIINIAGNTNQGGGNYNSVTPVVPYVSPTPSPTVSVTPSVTPTHSVTPSPLPSPVNSPTPSVTPTYSASSTPLPSVSRTPAPSNTPTPTVTPTPSPFGSACSFCISLGYTCCVAINSFLPDGKLAGSIRINDTMILADEITLEAGEGVVTYSEPSLQPTVRIVTENGASLVCSTTAPLATKRGLLNAPDVLNEYVAVMIEGKPFWDKVIEVSNTGEQMVQHITVGDKCFWAGESNDKFLLHHNLKICRNGCTWTGPNCCLCP